MLSSCRRLPAACCRLWPTPQSDALRFRFSGDSKAYFKLWAVNLLLTIATVGIYGAWAKVRNRRYIYGNTYLHDASFDYHANPRSILVARLFVVAIYITLSAAGVNFYWMRGCAIGWSGYLSGCGLTGR